MQVPNPSNIANQQGVCPLGSYCPEGTSTLNQCPLGTYNNALGATSLNDCLPCPAGKFCNILGASMTALIADTTNFGDCLAGYVCF